MAGKRGIDLFSEFKQLLFILVIVVTSFFSCLGWNGDEPIITERDKCEALAYDRHPQSDPESCRLTLAVASSEGPFFYNLLLLECIAYQLDMKKCKKKSDILPSGSSF